MANHRNPPESLILDSGPEPTSKAMFEWAQANNVAPHFIEPGKPARNAFVESFNGKFRDECLNAQWFVGLAHARAVIEAWRIHDNTTGPHSARGYQTPAASFELRKGSAQPPLSAMITTEYSRTTWP